MFNDENMKVILASGSPRRKELLAKLDMKFEVIVSDADETLNKNLVIQEQVKQLAYKKAKAVFESIEGNKIVIGADTMVFKENIIYGKPKDKEDAIKMLKDLQGCMHKVITGLCVLVENDGDVKEYLDYEISEVYVKSMSTEEILEWIKVGNPYDKAGGYAIQQEFMKFVEKINGNYENIVGLPISKLYDILKPIKIV